MGVNNRTSVNFVRKSNKTADYHNYSQLILEEDEIDYTEDEKNSGDDDMAEENLMIMKVRVNNKSVVENVGDPDMVYGMSNADSNLQYNNQYFEDKKNKERQFMYSNLTRMSIRKIVKKMEKNIMKKINKTLFEV